jgi:glycosyltransferase involved in cell wall biosynthesis
VTDSPSRTAEDPIISCIIPVYNGIGDLARAVSSALTQRPDVQVILVDDPSTDGSNRFVAKLAQEDSRVSGLLLPSNRGQGYARNVGVAAAQAPYITFLDQDDEHLPGWYDYALNALENNRGIAAVKGDIELVGIPAHVSVTRGDPRWRAMVNSVLWNVVMHKAIYGALGGCPTSTEFRSREGNEDIAFMLALVEHSQLATTNYLAARHYVKPNGATAFYLSRTRVVENRTEFVEITETERKASLAGTQSDSQNRATANLALLRDLLRPLSR